MRDPPFPTPQAERDELEKLFGGKAFAKFAIPEVRASFANMSTSAEQRATLWSKPLSCAPSHRSCSSGLCNQVMPPDWLCK